MADSHDQDFPSEVAREAYQEAERRIAAWVKAGDEDDGLNLSRNLHALDRLPPSLAELSQLQLLFLSGAAVTDINALARLSQLRTLDLLGTSVTDIAALAGLSHLKELFLSGTGVTDIDALAGLSQLRTLDLLGTSVTDIAALAGLSHLKELFLGGTGITDIGALADLSQLQWLDLSGAGVTDLTPLARFRKMAEWASDKVGNPYWGLHFQNCPNLSPELQAIAEIDNYKTRTLAALNHIRAELGLSSVEDWLAGEEEERPEPLEKDQSPFELGWLDGKLTITGDALGSMFTPEHRSSDDARKRLEAAKYAARSACDEIRSRQLQARETYADLLTRYADNLPNNQHGNIYLADTDLRTIRDDLVDDLAAGYLTKRAASRIVRVLEAHYGLRVYFPDLIGFYDDIKRGALTGPPPTAAFDALLEIVRTYTPDVFDQSVSEAAKKLDAPLNNDPPKPDQQAPLDGEEVDVFVPPDPIADVDPATSRQHAKAGFWNRVYKTILRADKGAKRIERIEKVTATFGRWIEPVLELLRNLPPG